MEKEYAIVMNGIVKEFKVLNRREGLKGSLLDLFSRDYRTVTAVDDISVKIPKGQIVGYLGPNGAGKSTTIKMMTGVLEPIKTGRRMRRRSAWYSGREASCGGRFR